MLRFPRRLLAGVFLFSFLWVQPTPALADGLEDAQSVFCLAAAHRTSLVAAASTLDLVSDGSSPKSIQVKSQLFTGEHAIEAWRNRSPTGFEKACKALIEATSISEGNSRKENSNLDFLNWLLPIVAGSALTLLATELQGARARRIAVADSIRVASTAFRDSLIEYTTAWTQTAMGGEPNTTILDKQRTQLITALRKAGIRDSWPFLKKLIEYIDSPDYRKKLKEGWHGGRPEREQKANTLLSHMARLEADGERVATLTASIVPITLRRGRKKNPTSVTNP